MIYTMKTKEIHQINQANLVLRHFVELSAKLLPFLYELHRKRKLTPQEKASKEKIIEVYRSYEFETSTSEILMGSNVLELVKRSFETIQIQDRKRQLLFHSHPLQLFLNEYERLRQRWNTISAN